MSNKKKQQKRPRAPFSSNRKRKPKWTTFVIYLMIIAMLLSTFLMAAVMFL